LIEDAFERTLDARALTRRDWQVLNTLAVAPATGAELDRTLGLFERDDPAGLARVVDGLAGRGWVGQDREGRIRLTPQGGRAYAEMRDQVAEFRRRATEGIGSDEYAAAVTTLSRMGANPPAARACFLSSDAAPAAAGPSAPRLQ